MLRASTLLSLLSLLSHLSHAHPLLLPRPIVDYALYHTVLLLAIFT